MTYEILKFVIAEEKQKRDYNTLTNRIVSELHKLTPGDYTISIMSADKLIPSTLTEGDPLPVGALLEPPLHLLMKEKDGFKQSTYIEIKGGSIVAISIDYTGAVEQFLIVDSYGYYIDVTARMRSKSVSSGSDIVFKGIIPGYGYEKDQRIECPWLEELINVKAETSYF